jgi:hypothetical protein
VKFFISRRSVWRVFCISMFLRTSIAGQIPLDKTESGVRTDSKPCSQRKLGTVPSFAAKASRREDVHAVWVEDGEAFMSCWQAQVGAGFDLAVARKQWQGSPVVAFLHGSSTVYYLNASLVGTRDAKKVLHRAVAHVAQRTWPTADVATKQPSRPADAAANWNSDSVFVFAPK